MFSRQLGFTLTEIMIVVAIVAIIAALAFPAYTNYAREANRVDAQTALLMLTNQQEKTYVANNTYTADMRLLIPNCASVVQCDNGGASWTSDKGLYTVTVTAANATAFTLQATAVVGSSQADDVGCTTIQLDSASRRTPATCWGN